MSSGTESPMPQDESYKTTEANVPVGDDTPLDNGEPDEVADSDEQLAKDDADAIDKSNIVDSRTRGAGKQAGTYAEPGDDEGLPTDD